MKSLRIFRQTLRHPRHFVLLLAACLACIFPALSFAQTHSAPASVSPTASGSITGKVSEKHGGPMAGARINVLNIQTGVSSIVATDVNGQFTVENLSPGAYKVSISASGCIPQDDKVTVKPGHKSKLSTTLKPSIQAAPAAAH
jgi:protocatechuate 3,4-dioxygenase beta subunit